jgi:hypothetical protein
MFLSGTFGYTLVGYTPAAEIGFFHFEQDGSVIGGHRSSTADGEVARFNGHYRFNGPTLGAGGRTIPLGIITVSATNEPESSWDYTFIVIDDAEIMLASSGRSPNSGVMVGTMKRIHAQILTPGSTGSRK